MEKYDIVSRFKGGTTLISILKNKEKITSDFEAGRSSETNGSGMIL